MFTILSYNITNEIGQINVQIHGHYEDNNGGNTEISGDQILKKCVMENTTTTSSSDNSAADHLHISSTADSIDEGFIFCPKMDSNGWQGLPNGEKFGMVYDANTITVWEKFGRPGRLYGETPKKKLIRVFQKVAYNGGVMVLAPPIPPKSTTLKVAATAKDVIATATANATAETTSADKHSNFNNVVVELKERLANRRAKMLEKSLDRFEPPAHRRISQNTSCRYSPSTFQVNPFYQATFSRETKNVITKKEDTHENLNQLIEEILAEIRQNKRTYSTTSDNDDEEETGEYYEDREGSIVEYSEEEEEISDTTPMDMEDDETQRYWNWATPTQSQVDSTTEEPSWPSKSWSSSNSMNSERREFDCYAERLEKELESYHNVVCDWKDSIKNNPALYSSSQFGFKW